MLFNFFNQMTCHLKKIVAVIFIVLIASCSGSKKYFKAAEKLEKQGLVGEAAEYYYVSLDRKKNNVEARLKLKEVGQKHVNNLSSSFFREYNTQQYEKSIDTFDKLKEFTSKSLVFVGYVVMKGNTTNLSDTVHNVFIQAGTFRNTAGSSGGSSIVSLTLDGIYDVNISGPTNGQALVYNSGVWENGTPISASNVLYSNIGQKPTLVSGSSQIDVRNTTGIATIASTGSNTFIGNQIITGSLNVSGTITANEYHTTIVSSSVLYTSGSTKFGDTGDDKHQFTGSVLITGSLSVTGSVSLRDSLTVGGTLIATAISGSGAGLTDIGVTEKIFYVSEDGADTNDGKTLSTSFRTIKAAINAASASLALNTGLPVYRQSVQVKSGYYVEEAPITVPSNVSILGDDLRSVVIRPTTGTKTENLFLMNNGTYCWGLRLEGCEIDDLDNPRKGFFFAFAPDAYIVTSPYIQNCSAISTPADKFYTPLDYANNNPLVGNGPGGMIIDDSVLNGYSPLKSMIVDAYTQVAFNGIGICIRGRGYGQLVSFFTNFSSTGVFTIDGVNTKVVLLVGFDKLNAPKTTLLLAKVKLNTWLACNESVKDL